MFLVGLFGFVMDLHGFIDTTLTMQLRREHYGCGTFLLAQIIS